MMNEEYIQKLVENFLEKASFSGSVTVEKDENRYQVSITTDDGGLLIGQGGTHILALQHLIRLCLRKEAKDEEGVNIYVDVNGYWKEKEKILEQEALEAAKKVMEGGESVVLRAMNAHERKIVHDTLAKEAVTTESTGFGTDRRIVVKRAN
ncbi:MAG: KH domain-containing protein [Candidatus Moranbacteria bacterium]|nr:KH domain-containing protein [Candidatus Moranbacteria bacterium]